MTTIHYPSSANFSRLKAPITISVTPTIGTGLYTTADSVGGLLTFANAADVEYGTGVIKAVNLIDKDSEEDAYELHLFNRSVTVAADHDPVAFSDADLAYYVGRIDIATGDYTTFAANSAAHTTADLPFNLADAGTSLFGNLVVRGGPTYTATSDLIITLVIQQD